MLEDKLLIIYYVMVGLYKVVNQIIILVELINQIYHVHIMKDILLLNKELMYGIIQIIIKLVHKKLLFLMFQMVVQNYVKDSKRLNTFILLFFYFNYNLLIY